ncbi:hypothetical protein HanRHA438_Chr01g0045301 [Helianthus annuus]|nr:hypothetical protein HanRHA438_Chr01g0045301 [Helianthus annuus]
MFYLLFLVLCISLCVKNTKIILFNKRATSWLELLTSRARAQLSSSLRKMSWLGSIRFLNEPSLSPP